MKKYFLFIIAILLYLSTPALADGPLKSDVGEELYNSNCSLCHGSRGVGTPMGPPLVHKIYEPGHHGDPSFHMAVTRGVGAHHWSFGNMAPIKGVDRAQVDEIIKYIRGLQREAGIN